MNRIKELRVQNKETQEELGKIVNLSKATISKYESGELDISNDTLIKLADHYNVSIDYLLGRTSDEPIQIAASMKDGLDISDLIYQIWMKMKRNL